MQHHAVQPSDHGGVLARPRRQPSRAAAWRPWRTTRSRPQSAVTKADVLEAADRDRELGLTPQLRVPRTRVAGPRLSAQVGAARRVPSAEESRSGTTNSRSTNPGARARAAPRACATYVQTIGEVYLGELHGSSTRRQRAPTVRRWCGKRSSTWSRTLSRWRRTTASDGRLLRRAERKRAQRCSRTTGCYIMKQLGCHNTEGKQNMREVVKRASSWPSGCCRYQGTPARRLARAARAVRAPAHRSAGGAGHGAVRGALLAVVYRARAQGLGDRPLHGGQRGELWLSLQNQDPNKFVERCGTFPRLCHGCHPAAHVGAPLPAAAGRGGAALDRCTIGEACPGWASPVALNINLPLATDVALRAQLVHHIVGGRPEPVDQIRGAKTLVSVGAFRRGGSCGYGRGARPSTDATADTCRFRPAPGRHRRGLRVGEHRSQGRRRLAASRRPSTLSSLMKLNGSVDWSRVFASVAKDAPSIRQPNPRPRPAQLQHRTLAAAVRSAALVPVFALARCSFGGSPASGTATRSWKPPRSSSRSTRQRHDEGSEQIGQYRPLTLEDNLQTLMAQAAAHDVDFATMPCVGKAVGVFQLASRASAKANAEAEADAPAAEA